MKLELYHSIYKNQLQTDQKTQHKTRYFEIAKGKTMECISTHRHKWRYSELDSGSLGNKTKNRQISYKVKILLYSKELVE